MGGITLNVQSSPPNRQTHCINAGGACRNGGERCPNRKCHYKNSAIIHQNGAFLPLNECNWRPNPCSPDQNAVLHWFNDRCCFRNERIHWLWEVSISTIFSAFPPWREIDDRWALRFQAFPLGLGRICKNSDERRVRYISRGKFLQIGEKMKKRKILSIPISSVQRNKLREGRTNSGNRWAGTDRWTRG